MSINAVVRVHSITLSCSRCGAEITDPDSKSVHWLVHALSRKLSSTHCDGCGEVVVLPTGLSVERTLPPFVAPPSPLVHYESWEGSWACGSTGAAPTTAKRGEVTCPLCKATAFKQAAIQAAGVAMRNVRSIGGLLDGGLLDSSRRAEKSATDALDTINLLQSFAASALQQALALLDEKEPS